MFFKKIQSKIINVEVFYKYFTKHLNIYYYIHLYNMKLKRIHSPTLESVLYFHVFIIDFYLSHGTRL